MGSPAIFSGKFTKLLTQLGIMQSNGALLQNDGPKNYIKYAQFENAATTGWSLGTTGTLTNGIPTGTPTFGSGASGTLAITAQTTGALSGSYSLQMADSAATTAGNMVASAALAIDPSDQAKVLTYKLNYSVSANAANGNFSGTSSNTFGIAAWDVTNSAWLPVAGNFNFVQNSGSGVATGTMQTNLTTASVRFVIYCANASTGAITMLFDDFYLGPQVAPTGFAGSDWQSFTPTGSWVSNTTYAGKVRRVGDTKEYQVSLTLTGAPTNTQLTINLPGADTIDTSKINSAISQTDIFGSAKFIQGQFFQAGVVSYNTTTSVAVYSSVISTSQVTQQSVTATTPATWAATHTIQIEFRVPIVGLSSNTVMSNDTDTRVISFTGSSSSTQAVTANTTNTAATAVTDRAGAWTGSTYIVPVAGDYVVAGGVISSASAQTQFVYLNGVVYANGGFSTAAASGVSAGSVLVAGCRPGDVLSIRSSATVTLNQVNISIFRLSGPSVISATESVNARYYSSSTTVSGSLATILYTTKAFDSHNAYNPATGIYTAPVSGKYQVNSAIAMTGTFVLNSILDLQIQSTGVSPQVSESKAYSGGAVTQMNTNVGDVFWLNAGDTIKVQASNSGTAPVIAATTSQNWISIARVGN